MTTIKSIRELLCEQMYEHNISPLDVLITCDAEDNAFDQIHESFADLSDHDVADAISKIAQERDELVEQTLDNAIVNMINKYEANVPDALEIILQITMREVFKTVNNAKGPCKTFRDQAHEIIDLN